MRKRAFTLIELLVVIVIIGILAAIIILALNNARKKAADKALQDSLAKVAESLAAYRTEANDDKYPKETDYPGALQDPAAIVQLPKNINDAQGNQIGYRAANVRANYIIFGQRVGTDWYFIKDGDKCFEDGIGSRPNNYNTAVCPTGS